MKKIILVCLCTVGIMLNGAWAAKLCKVNAPASYSSTAGSASVVGTWVVGTGCKNGACSKMLAYGYAYCATSGFGGYDPGNVSNIGSGQYCYCKRGSSGSGVWVFLSASVSADSCSANCANACGNNIQGNARFRAAVFAVP